MSPSKSVRTIDGPKQYGKKGKTRGCKLLGVRTGKKGIEQPCRRKPAHMGLNSSDKKTNGIRDRDGEEGKVHQGGTKRSHLGEERNLQKARSTVTGCLGEKRERKEKTCQPESSTWESIHRRPAGGTKLSQVAAAEGGGKVRSMIPMEGLPEKEGVFSVGIKHPARGGMGLLYKGFNRAGSRTRGISPLYYHKRLWKCRGALRSRSTRSINKGRGG